jgi:hypothetical protein
MPQVVIVPPPGDIGIGQVKQVFGSQTLNMAVTETDVPFAAMPLAHRFAGWIIRRQAAYGQLVPIIKPKYFLQKAMSSQWVLVEKSVAYGDHIARAYYPVFASRRSQSTEIA